MDLEGIMLSEVSQTETDEYHVISLIYGIKNTQQTKIYNKKRSRHTDIDNKLLVTSEEVGRDNVEVVESGRYKLLVLR